MKRALILLSHACIILVLMLLVLLIVDRFNPVMGFINNDITKVMVLALCVIAAVLAVSFLLLRRR